MTLPALTAIAAGDTLAVALHTDPAQGARRATGLPGLASADAGAGMGAAAAPGATATLILTPLVESPLLAAGPIATPASVGIQLFDLTVAGEVFTEFEQRIIGPYTAFRSAMGWRYAGLYAVAAEGAVHPFARAVVYVVDVPTGAEAQALAAAAGAPPTEIRAFGEECSGYKTDPGTWLWLEPRPAA